MRRMGFISAALVAAAMQAGIAGTSPTHVIIDELEPPEPVKKTRPAKREPITRRIESPRQERKAKSKSLKQMLKQKGRK